jgi:hypothetical protein
MCNWPLSPLLQPPPVVHRPRIHHVCWCRGAVTAAGRNGGAAAGKRREGGAGGWRREERGWDLGSRWRQIGQRGEAAGMRGQVLGGYPKNSVNYPNTRESSKHVPVQSESAKRLWFPLQIAQVLKSRNPFTRALASPFIGRWRDFHMPKTPSASENIPSVNAYKNVFFV